MNRKDVISYLETLDCLEVQKIFSMFVEYKENETLLDKIQYLEDTIEELKNENYYLECKLNDYNYYD